MNPDPNSETLNPKPETLNPLQAEFPAEDDGRHAGHTGHWHHMSGVEG